MKVIAALSSLLVARSAFAHPLSQHVASKRQYSQQDIDVLNYALTLEHLEATFYAEALANYSLDAFTAQGYSPLIYENIAAVAAEEATHVQFLTAALQAAGAPAVAACTYAFPATDPTSFLTVASIVEGVGVSAYSGAGPLISNPDYLLPAAQIVAVEARHTAYLRKSLGEPGTPQTYDPPLDLDQVYTLAAPFIVSCPSSNPPLPVKAFPAAALGSSPPIKAGKDILIQTSATGATHAAWAFFEGPVIVPATAVSGGYMVTVPSGFGGQNYVTLINDPKTASDATTVAGPAIVEVNMVYGALGIS